MLVAVLALLLLSARLPELSVRRARTTAPPTSRLVRRGASGYSQRCDPSAAAGRPASPHGTLAPAFARSG